MKNTKEETNDAYTNEYECAKPKCSKEMDAFKSVYKKYQDCTIFNCLSVVKKRLEFSLIDICFTIADKEKEMAELKLRLKIDVINKKDDKKIENMKLEMRNLELNIKYLQSDFKKQTDLFDMGSLINDNLKI